MHLCDLVACTLPPERWWENGGSGSSRSLQRQGSGGRGRGRSSSNAQEAAALAELPVLDEVQQGA